MEKNAEVEKNKLKETIASLEERAKRAEGELDQIRQYVAATVAAYHQFPASVSAGSPLTHIPLATNTGVTPQRHGMQSMKGLPQATIPSAEAGNFSAGSPNWSSELTPGRGYLESARQLTSISRTPNRPY